MSKLIGLRGSKLLAIPAVLIALAAAALAQAPAHPQEMATMICRPGAGSESMNAKMGTEGLVCEPVALSMKMANGGMMTIGSVKAKADPGPDFSKALTPQQAQAAYQKWVLQEFHIDPLRVHNP